MSKKTRVLLVEDNAQNQYLVTVLLEHRGWSVTPASTGLAALELAASDRPDLVLLDIQLPGMDGYEVARRLRLLDRFDEVPIVAVTSYAMLGDRERALSAGCNGYIEKPIDPATFFDQLEPYVSRASQDRSERDDHEGPS
jgi:CheY-like chemotaxis protein